MNENVKVVFGLIGGLALFLYGMNKMNFVLEMISHKIRLAAHS